MIDTKPLYKDVTIAIPLYNEVRFIEKSIRSAVNQAVNIFISDNASTDGSIEVCQRLALKYPNIYFIQQEKNQGAIFNFAFLLEKCNTEYFMWLGAHDYLPDNYIELLRNKLDSDKEVALAYGNARRVNLGNNTTMLVHHYSELRNALESDFIDRRALAIVSSLNDCSLFHGLWRTEILRKVWVNEQFIGGDHVLLLRAALCGKLSYVKETEYGRGEPVRNKAKTEQIARITGGAAREVSYESLCRLSLNAIKHSCVLHNPRLTHSLAYLILVWRFGAFSQKKSIKLIETTFYKFGRALRVIKRKLIRIV